MTWNDSQPARPRAMRQPARLPLADTLVSAILRRLLCQLEAGSLTIGLPSGAVVELKGTHSGPKARISIRDWRTMLRVLIGGDVGFAEAYMDGAWSTPSLVTLLDCLHRNEAALQRAWGGWSLERLTRRLRHSARANTRRGSRRNIEAHYDLGNAFYSSWLDDGMNYSSALYTDASASLEDAQIAKLDRAISLLKVKPDDHVLEIGCGWGALAERLAVNHGTRVTGITLSREQLAYAERRLRNANAAGLAEFHLQDYRDVSGTFDAIVSIEMLEAAGEAYWPAYFAKLKECLRPGGVAVLQVITIEQHRFAAYRERPDFIQRYIFPGGMLPTLSLVRQHAEAAGLVVQSVETFGDSYARTLAEWRSRFLAATPPADAPQLNTERFWRMWHYYLAYCEIGFRTGALDVRLYQIAHR